MAGSKPFRRAVTLESVLRAIDFKGRVYDEWLARSVDWATFEESVLW